MAEKRIGSLAEQLPHPGETLVELLETYGMSQLELSERIGFTTKHINEVCKGKKPITPDMSMRLSAVFNLSSSFWNNLQANYDSEYNELINEETVTKEELELLKEVPLNELREFKYIDVEKTNSRECIVLKLRKFFKVSDLTYVPNVLNNTISAYRKSDKEINPIKLASWVSMCLHDYKPLQNQLDINRLKDQIPQLKKQVLMKDINIAINDVKIILASCGITFNVIHHLKGVPVQGYIRNMNNNILLTLTIRQKFSDIFWFTFFHEIGHILSNKDKKTLNMIDYEKHSDFADEIQADEFASNTLISKESYKEFKQSKIDLSSIKALAKKEGVTESIVVGRLGHEDPSYYVNYSFLRTKYEWGN